LKCDIPPVYTRRNEVSSAWQNLRSVHSELIDFIERAVTGGSLHSRYLRVKYFMTYNFNKAI
jgi:hypothetical protein